MERLVKELLEELEEKKEKVYAITECFKGDIDFYGMTKTVYHIPLKNGRKVEIDTGFMEGMEMRLYTGKNTYSGNYYNKKEEEHIDITTEEMGSSEEAFMNFYHSIREICIERKKEEKEKLERERMERERREKVAKEKDLEDFLGRLRK